jgi:hypothetical protein
MSYLALKAGMSKAVQARPSDSGSDLIMISRPSNSRGFPWRRHGASCGLAALGTLRVGAVGIVADTPANIRTRVALPAPACNMHLLGRPHCVRRVPIH